MIPILLNLKLLPMSRRLNKTDFNIYYFTNNKTGNYIEAFSTKIKSSSKKLRKRLKKLTNNNDDNGA